jgi:hypothetical protein
MGEQNKPGRKGKDVYTFRALLETCETPEQESLLVGYLVLNALNCGFQKCP